MPYIMACRYCDNYGLFIDAGDGDDLYCVSHYHRAPGLVDLVADTIDDNGDPI